MLLAMVERPSWVKLSIDEVDEAFLREVERVPG